jgi:anti-anti-sigma factor
LRHECIDAKGPVHGAIAVRAPARPTEDLLRGRTGTNSYHRLISSEQGTDSMSLVTFEHKGGSVLVIPSCPRLDAEVASEFSRRVASQVQGRSLVTVSLADVEAIDCSGLAALVIILQSMPPGGVLRLTGVRPSASELLEATGLAAIFPVVEDATTDAAPAVDYTAPGDPSLPA